MATPENDNAPTPLQRLREQLTNLVTDLTEMEHFGVQSNADARKLIEDTERVSRALRAFGHIELNQSLMALRPEDYVPCVPVMRFFSGDALIQMQSELMSQMPDGRLDFRTEDDIMHFERIDAHTKDKVPVATENYKVSHVSLLEYLEDWNQRSPEVLIQTYEGWAHILNPADESDLGVFDVTLYVASSTGKSTNLSLLNYEGPYSIETEERQRTLARAIEELHAAFDEHHPEERYRVIFTYER
jgi:hypothetical protein